MLLFKHFYKLVFKQFVSVWSWDIYTIVHKELYWYFDPWYLVYESVHVLTTPTTPNIVYSSHTVRIDWRTLHWPHVRCSPVLGSGRQNCSFLSRPHNGYFSSDYSNFYVGLNIICSFSLQQKFKDISLAIPSVTI